jgi:hypothetical protein
MHAGEADPVQGDWVRFWTAWMRVMRSLGSFVGRVQLTLLYFSILVPFAVLTRRLSDPLNVSRRKREAGPRWHPLPDCTPSWEDARRQG